MNTLVIAPSDSMTALVEDPLTFVVDLDDDPEPRYDALPDVGVVVGAPAIWVNDEDSSQDEEFVFAIEQLRPRLFVLETVRGLAGPKYVDFLHDLIDDLADLGYEVGYELVALGGRKRLVIIGHRNGSTPVFRTPRGARGPATITDIISTNLEAA